MHACTATQDGAGDKGVSGDRALTLYSNDYNQMIIRKIERQPSTVDPPKFSKIWMNDVPALKHQHFTAKVSTQI